MLATKQRNRISLRKEFIEQNRLRVSYERRLRLQMLTVFAEHGARASSDFRLAGRIINADRDFQINLKQTLDNHYRAVIEEFGLRILRNNKQDPRFETIIEEYIRLYGAIRVSQISSTTLRQIQRIITASQIEGLSVAAIAALIFDSQRGTFTKYRSATIARTETHSAASFANHAVNKSFNIPMQKKRWVAVADERARPWHTAMNGKEVPLDEDFIVNTNGLPIPMSYTGDPKGGASNVINCRCVTVYFSPEDELED